MDLVFFWLMNTEKLLFVKQYRNSINGMDIEIPAGCARQILMVQRLMIKCGSLRILKMPENPFYRCAL